AQPPPAATLDAKLQPTPTTAGRRKPVLARALENLREAEPPRKRPKLLTLADQGAELEAELTWLSQWMDAHASKWRLHSKPGSSTRFSEQQAQAMEKFLSDAGAVGAMVISS
ncbi:unnamed protein product, partial [Polarella glacialis]